MSGGLLEASLSIRAEDSSLQTFVEFSLFPSPLSLSLSFFPLFCSHLTMDSPPPGSFLGAVWLLAEAAWIYRVKSLL